MLAAVANALQKLCVTIRFVGKKAQPYAGSLTSYTMKKTSFLFKIKKYVILFIAARKIPLTTLVTAGHSFRILS